MKSLRDEICLAARDVAFGSDVHCVSDVSPCGEVANITSLCDEGAIHHYGEAITSLRLAAISLFTNDQNYAII